MTTRSIVTSQPDVACDVCARRLLRGEQPDYFIADGRRRLVCELCAPRATHEGWLRETDAVAEVTLPPTRPRRGRSLLDRLAMSLRPRGEKDGMPAHSARPAREERRGAGREPAGEATPFDLLGGDASDEDAAEPVRAASAGEAHSPPGYPELAVGVFNASEFPRRIAGVARSLGEPVVSVRSAEHLDSVVRIVVAWELSWYRYEVDLGEEPAAAVAIGQGTELAELEREEREGNAVASASGALALAQ